MSRASEWQRQVEERPRLLILPDTKEEIGLTATVTSTGGCEIVISTPLGDKSVRIPKTYTLALAHFLQTTWGDAAP